MVAVISNSGTCLMPTSEYRARRLLKKGCAEIYKYRPFTIRLLDRENGDVQGIEYCSDTGYIHIGTSIKSAKHEYVDKQVDTLSDETERHNDQRKLRRARRNRKRYRKPRFNNRKATKDSGWLAPSIRHKMEIHLQQLEIYMSVMPITRIVFEMGQFDTQVLKAVAEGRPLPKGEDYQKGERYGISTLREAVFTRDNHTCVCCRRTIKDNAILHMHHLGYRNGDRTNRMSNLATVCERCHTSKNHKEGGRLYNLKPALKNFKGATFMTVVRWQMYNKIREQYPDVEVKTTYGADTKESRRVRHIKKSHVNDAYIIGSFRPKHRTPFVLEVKQRRNNRILEKFYDAKYIDSRDGNKKAGKELTNGRISRSHKKDSENEHLYRSSKVSKGRRSVRKQRYPLQPHDTVVFKGLVFTVKGTYNNGARVILNNGKSVAVSKIKQIRYCGGYRTQLQ